MIHKGGGKLIGIWGLLILLSGCSQKMEVNRDVLKNQETVANLFAQEAETTVETEIEVEETETETTDVFQRTASFGHGPASLLEDEDGTSYLLYEGGVYHMEYFIESNQGLSDTGLGFMIFIDGQAQPFYTEEEPEYAYMHVYYPEDGQTIQTTFSFVPVTGQAGDELEIYTVSIWYPDFTPDMIDTFNFANFRDMSEAINKIRYEATPEMTAAVEEKNYPQIQKRLSALRVDGEELTVNAKQYLLNTIGISEDALEDQTFSMFYIDGIDMRLLENYDTEGKDTLHLRVEMVGCPLAEYGITFYVNNEPVSCDGLICSQIQLTQGNVSVVEAELDISDLEGINVLSAVMIPRNGIKMKTAGKQVYLIQSSPIALYDSSSLSE
jgi:hypothetical protein